MLLGLPLEILHVIFFDVWILDHVDIAAVRATCQQLRNAVMPTGLDSEKWLARAGPKACTRENRPRALLKCYESGSPHDARADGGKLIVWASIFEHPRVVKFMLAHGANPAEYGNMAIRCASEGGCVEIVQDLLAAGADPLAEGSQSVRLASIYNHPETVELLLAAGCDPTTKQNGALVAASRKGNVDVVRLLLEDSRVDPSFPGNHAIRWASKCGQREVVTLLMTDERVAATWTGE